MQVLDKQIESVVQQALSFVATEQAGLLRDFAQAYLSQLAQEDAECVQVGDLAGQVLTHFMLLQQYDGTSPLIRVFNPSVEGDHFHCAHTVVEIVVRDRPFLVDTLQMTLEAEGLAMHRLLHTIVQATYQQGVLSEVRSVENSDEKYLSVMYCEIDRQCSAEDMARVRSALLEKISLLDRIVQDWQPMRAHLQDIRQALQDDGVPSHQGLNRSEVVDFIDWLLDGHFTFLGFREYRVQEAQGRVDLYSVGNSGLGLLAGDGQDRCSRSFGELSAELKEQLLQPQVLLLSKSSHVSPVHRHVHMDFIGIQRFDAQGRVIGEYRFLGLFTASAYQLNVAQIPLLREKAAQVLARARLPVGGHAYKKMVHILNTLPRDDLFQSSVDELYATAKGILHLQDKKRLRLFVRVDHYQRFVSCLVYIPRDKFNTQLRIKFQQLLQEAMGGISSEFNTQFSELNHARLHIHIRTLPGQIKPFQVQALEVHLVAAMQNWQDDYERSLLESFGESDGNRLVKRFASAMPVSYQERYSPRTAIKDTERLAGIDAQHPIDLHLYQSVGERSGQLHLKVYGHGEPVTLSFVLPVLENFGVSVSAAHPYSFVLSEGEQLWMQEYDLLMTHAESVDMATVRTQFEEAFARIWRGEVESDRFNELVLATRLNIDEVVILRALSRYMLQARAPFSAEYVQQTLNKNHEITVALIDLFHARMRPDVAHREQDTAQIRQHIESLLQSVSSLDEDRILRWYLNLMNAMLRTNYYQRDADGQRKNRLSFKFAASTLEDLPKPRPMFEIFVYSPRVEAVHLRGGKVARGGLRWSDRMDDFRTEILGLVKAQMVKNAVIVPVGSKGGFIVKTPTQSREAFMAEGKACYQTFIRGMLDITDNLVNGEVVAPEQTVRHDGDDPYLVVAADKGTASFSDIANGVAAEYGFWLGDAFASGGSVGYDHKAMGITARGAWESVKRHFRLMGKNIQEEDFTVVGIGDMSGDVFGNGMLLSKHTKLLAGFNHLHIFIDPNPEDTERSFAERQRLFALPRSSWADYNQDLISRGGGVFSRQDKSIAITSEMKAAFDIHEDKLTPTDLINRLLKAPVDLIWNGGIGTYVKHSDESHSDVGDRANDALRVNGNEVRAKVIGEGGNLGMTQRGRIEYALHGGRLYTDAIDNSGGVNCSDHEVNIKILLNSIVERGDMTTKQRNHLLSTMTDEVGALVLRQNYLQPQTIELAAQQVEKLPDYMRIIRQLEQEGRLDRAIEFLPDDAEAEQRKKEGRGLTNPELAVLLAYAKMWVYEHLLSSSLPENAYFHEELRRYFPKTLQEHYGADMVQHRLFREIICTYLTNSLVNRMGIGFVFRAVEEGGEAVEAIAGSYAVVREIFAAREYWALLESLDNQVDAQVQIRLEMQIRQTLERAMFWFLRHVGATLDVAGTVARFVEPMAQLTSEQGYLSQHFAEQIANEVQQLQALGVTEVQAHALARLSLSVAALDIVLLAEQSGQPAEAVAETYFSVQDALHGQWLSAHIQRLPADNYWSRRARTALQNNLNAILRGISQALLLRGDRVSDWAATRETLLRRLDASVAELDSVEPDLATLSVVLGELSALNVE